jgi:HK97 family phage major capsid protein
VNGGLIAPDSSYNIKAAFNQTTGASGGYLVPDPLYAQIIAKRNLSSWVRQLPVQMFQTPSDHLPVPVEDTSHTAFVQTAEAAAYDENEGTVAQKDLILYKYTKLVKASEEFLANQGTNFDSWLTNALARAEAVTENTIFTSGSGSGAPQGVVTGATVANTTATTDVILPAELTALFGYLGAGYNVRSECGVLMNNATKWYLAGSTGNPFLYNMTPSGDVINENLMGYKLVVDDDVVTYTTASSKCIVFGNFNYYGVVEKPGMLVQRNPYLYMANGQVGIFANIFRGGAVLQSEAFYYLTNHS